MNPVGSYTFGDLLEDCQAVTDTTVTPVWIDDGFLGKHELEGALPIYGPGEVTVPGSAAARPTRPGSVSGPSARRCAISCNGGTACRPSGMPRQFALTPEREAKLIAEWRAQPRKAQKKDNKNS